MKLKIASFMNCKEETEVEFPQQGVVLITGANGEGKSSIIEGVAYGKFGKTVRGTSPWREGQAGDVEIEEAGLRIRRHRQPSGKVDVWFSRDGEPVAYENATKAQQAISAVVGDFDVWRRSCVFSSHDAAHFTLATDAERKRLIESAIGLTVFNDALESCRRDLAQADRECREASAEVARLGERVAGAGARLSDALKVLEAAPPAVDVPGLETKLGKARTMLQEIDRDIQKANVPVQAAYQEAEQAAARIADARRAEEAARGGVCRACGQALPAKEQTLKEMAALIASLQSKEKTAREVMRALVLGVKSLEGEREETQRLLSGFEAQLKTAWDTARRREAAEAAVANAKAAVKESEQQLKQQSEKLGSSQERVGVLMAVAQVLGTKGVRAQILSRALSSMEAVANLWLERIAGAGLTLSLKPWTEKKAGGVSDSIALEVAGAGGGLGYRASSGGERRRIDIALMLALSEVATAASGQPPGILFGDEVFDALDADGVTAVAGALATLGATRPVVVISHSIELADRLRPTLRLRVSGGVVQRE